MTSLIRRTWLPTLVFVAIAAVSDASLGLAPFIVHTTLAAALITPPTWTALVRGQRVAASLLGAIAGGSIGVLAQLLPFLIPSWVRHALTETSGLGDLTVIVFLLPAGLAGLVGIFAGILLAIAEPVEVRPRLRMARELQRAWIPTLVFACLATVVGCVLQNPWVGALCGVAAILCTRWTWMRMTHHEKPSIVKGSAFGAQIGIIAQISPTLVGMLGSLLFHPGHSDGGLEALATNLLPLGSVGAFTGAVAGAALMSVPLARAATDRLTGTQVLR